MNPLIPSQAPALAPLANSAEFDALEADVKAIFSAVFNNVIRPGERALNLYGMPHLGDIDLLSRALQEAGLAMVRQDPERIRFLLKAWRGRNPRRGTAFLRAYLQTAFPNEWEVAQLWHPIASIANYPQACAVVADPDTHFKTSRIRVGIGISAATPSELITMARALRSTLAARLVLEIGFSGKLATNLGYANACACIVPVVATGTVRL